MLQIQWLFISQDNVVNLRSPKIEWLTQVKDLVSEKKKKKKQGFDSVSLAQEIPNLATVDP